MHAEKDKTADIICIKCKIRNFKKFHSSNRLSDLRYVFTVRLVASRPSKLDPMLLCSDEFFPKPKVTNPITSKLPTP